MSRPLVILDRDGVINHDSSAFIKSPDEWQGIDGAPEAIGRLCQAGFRVAVATNQSGVGRGLVDLAALSAIHEKMRACVELFGGEFEQIVFCPHHPDDDCDCRKPKPGLLLELAHDFDLSVAGVPVIGDSLRDIDAAVAVDARPILVLTGNGQETAAALTAAQREVETYADLSAAADALLAEMERNT